MFIDEAKIYVKAGNGGNGVASFRREKNVPTGGPDGGNGGRGGNVIIKAFSNLSSLLDFKYKTKYVAQSGADGNKANRYGKAGEDLIIKVPVGTLIIDNDKIIADLNEPNSEYVVCRGGRGGFGNNYYKSATRQAPTFAQQGGAGQERTIKLELKLLADVGIIGMPNVGKSTFISAVSNSRPKIANYAFTTLIPNLGVVKHNDKNLVFADMPGLIEGASAGVGLGHAFLKHVERTKLFLHILDGFLPDEQIIENHKIINSELEKFDKKLKNRPQIIAINKADVNPNLENVSKELGAFIISGATHQGIDKLLDKVFEVAKDLENEQIEVEKDAFFDKIDSDEIIIKKQNEKFLVINKTLEKIANGTDFESPISVAYFRKMIKEHKLEEKLKEAGANYGDIIIIDEIEFDFEQ